MQRFTGGPTEKELYIRETIETLLPKAKVWLNKCISFMSSMHLINELDAF